MSNKDHRQQKKTAKKLKRKKIKMETDRRKVRNSRAARFHQILRRPGRGGLSALGAEQLRKHFSTKSSQDEKLSIGAMDPTASMTVLQMAAEEVDAAEMTYEGLREVAEEIIMASGGGEREAAVNGGDEEVDEETIMASGEGKREAAVNGGDEEVDEETIMASGEGKREAAVNGGDEEADEVTQREEAMKAEGDVESEDEGMGEADEEQGGVALAKDY